jgi:Tfp pilus assembly protein PilV
MPRPVSTIAPASLAAFAAVAVAFLLSPCVRATILTASDGATADYFGYSVSASGDSVLAGAYFDDDKGTDSGSAYYYKGLNGEGKRGTVNETVKLLAFDSEEDDHFGVSLSLSADSALVGVSRNDGKGSDSESVYYYKGLNSVNGNQTDISSLDGKNATWETVKLLASDSEADDHFGGSLSLSAESALVGAYQHDDDGKINSGSAYYYKGLNGAEKGGTVEQDVKLVASDGTAEDYFGISVSLSTDNALVGAYQHDDDGKINSGSAYYYKGLNGAEKGSTVEQDVKLVASDGAAGDLFGVSVSLSGDSALVGTQYGDGKESSSGSAYYYKGLNEAEKGGTVEQDVKLVASDGATEDYFGRSASLSADIALVGALGDDDKGSNSGSAYYYKGLNGYEKNSTVYQDVKLLASDGAASDQFGRSVSLSGDRFVIGARSAWVGVDGTAVQTGKAYAGDIRAFTTLDADGGATLATDGISFVSQGDWIIGETTSGNQVTLGKVWSFNQANLAGAWFKDTADVTADGKAVYIGKDTDADNNTLIIEGTLAANSVYVGTEDNSGNTLRMAVGGRINATTGAALVELSAGNTIVFDLGVAEGEESSGTTDTRTGLVVATNLVFGGTLELVAGEGFEAVIGNEYKLFDLVTGESPGGSGITGQFDVVTAFDPGEDFYWDYSLLYSDGLVRIAGIDPGSAVPEPSAWAAIAGVVLFALAALRRRVRH